MKYDAFVPFAETMFRSGLPFMVEGEPGIGKTALINQACQNLGFDLIVTEIAVRSPIDLGGIPAQTRPAVGKKPAEWDFVPIGDLRRLVNAKKPTVWLLDDFGQGSTSTQNATCHIIHAGRVGEAELSKHVRICAATNRAEDKSGTNPIYEHVKSRFNSIIHLEIDVPYWVRWAHSCEDVGLLDRVEPMPKIIPAFISWKGRDMLFNFQPKPGLENSRSPRTVHAVGKMLAAGAVTEHNALEVITRATDRGLAIEFLAYLKLWAHLPDPDDVLDDPDIIDNMMFDQYVWDENKNDVVLAGQSPISKRPDVAYALVTSTSEIVKPGDMGNFARLVQKFTKPVEVMGMLLVQNRNEKELNQTRAFVEWSTNNQVYML